MTQIKLILMQLGNLNSFIYVRQFFFKNVHFVNYIKFEKHLNFKGSKTFKFQRFIIQNLLNFLEVTEKIPLNCFFYNDLPHLLFTFLLNRPNSDFVGPLFHKLYR